MNNNTKTLLLQFLFNGLMFAILMALFDHFGDGKEFNIKAFIFRFLFFGFGMTIFKYIQLRKNKINKQ